LSDTISLARRFVDLTQGKKALAAKLKEANKQLSELEQQLFGEMEEQGVQRISCDGHTLYLQRKLYARAKPDQKQAAILALQEMGLVHCVGVQSQGVSALFREEDGKNLPPDFVELFEVDERFSVNVRKD